MDPSQDPADRPADDPADRPAGGDPRPAPPDAAGGPELPERRAFLGIVGAAGLFAVGGGALAAYLALRPDDPVTAAAAPTTTAPVQLKVTPATLPTLPIPDPLPENAHAPTPQIVIGTIEIPRIGITADIQEGITLTAINRGPGHWPGTAMPGGWGNVVIAGHRTTYSKPFNRLNELVAGDPVVMTTTEGRFTYQVRGIVIVPGEAIDIAAQSYAHTATLFACHPPGSARQRIVAKLRLLDASGVPVDDEADLPPLEAGSQATDHTLVTKQADPLGDTVG